MLLTCSLLLSSACLHVHCLHAQCHAGRLSSPTTLVRGETRCKQFQLSTVDGPVKCIFWEMSDRLPSLVQGRTLRVVGQWDDKDEVMQCYAVREAVSGEDIASRKAVEVSDRTMRCYVAELHPH